MWSCEQANKIPGSIKYWEFLDWLRGYWLFKKDSTLWSCLLNAFVPDNKKMNTGSLQRQQTPQPHQPGRTITCYYCGFILREKHLQVYELSSQITESFFKTELKIVCHTDCLKDL